MLLGIAVIGAAIYLNGERNGGPPSFSELYYLWAALYVGYSSARC